MNNQATDLAVERTLLAKERTLASLVRTALALIGAGLALAKVLPQFGPSWLTRTIGTLLILGGLITSIGGFRIVHDFGSRLREKGVHAPRWYIGFVTSVVALTAILALLAVGLDL